MTEHPTPPTTIEPSDDADLDASHVDRRVQQLFGDVDSRRPRRRLRLAAAATAVVLVVGLVAASVAGSQDAAELRTATARTTDVASELTSVATMEPVSAAAVAFPADGTVESVDVAVGDTVTAGQALASLDEVELTRSRNAAVEQLARAELTLSQALAGEKPDAATGGAAMTPTSTGTSGSTSSSVSVTDTNGSAASTSGATATAALLTTAVFTTTSSDDQVVQLAATSDELDALQQAVLAAQRAVDAALLHAQNALDAANAVCDAEEIAEATTNTVAPSTTVTTAVAEDLTACREALAAVQVAQEETATVQRALATSSTALDEYLAQQAAAQGTGSTDGTGGTGAAGTDSSGGSAIGGSSTPGAASGTTTSSPSAADLIAYQKAVDAAELQVLVADQALARATIVSPIAGVVVTVGFDAGDSVSAASATQNITIQGAEGIEVVTTVALSDIASVELGQPATVLPDGAADALDGQVVAISPVPDSDTTTYRVTIGLTEPDVALGSGTTGSVAIVTADARDALAVPSSAVHVDARGATVTVVQGDGTEEVRVEVGVMGADWIEITSGLSEGDEVVLADLAEPLPGSATEADGTTGTGGATELLGGAGGFPTGPPGS